MTVFKTAVSRRRLFIKTKENHIVKDSEAPKKGNDKKQKNKRTKNKKKPTTCG